MKYASKVDTWLVVVVVISGLLPIGFLVFRSATAPAEEVEMMLLVTLVILAATYVVMYVSLWPCYYTLEKEHLHIRCGFLRSDIPYTSIKSAEKSANALSAPALSFKTYTR